MKYQIKFTLYKKSTEFTCSKTMSVHVYVYFSKDPYIGYVKCSCYISIEASACVHLNECIFR
jgi:hypothetical protein